jgi:UDP-N-acetylbacillosamine alanyltransferase
VAVSAALEMPVGEAMAWFEAMPQDQRLRSLAPDFAQADTRRAPGLACVHVGFEQGGARWLHTLHLRAVPGFGWSAISPYGYGGPLCNSEDPAFIRRAWDAYQAWARGREVLGEFCRFHPEARHQRFFLGDVRPNRATISVDLQLRPVETQFNTLARRKLKRTNEVPVRWSRHADDWRAFGVFYRRAMATMGAHERYHFRDEYFAAIAALQGVELCICGEDAGWLSAGVYLFQRRSPDDASPGGTLEYHLGASSEAGHAIGSAYRLQHAAAQEGAARGLAQLYLGGGTTTDADDPLLFYKRAFSRRERTFHVGNAVHHEALYGAFALSRGYHRESAPINLLFD